MSTQCCSQTWTQRNRIQGASDMRIVVLRKFAAFVTCISLAGLSAATAAQAGERQSEVPRLVSPVLALEQPLHGPRPASRPAGTGKLVMGGILGAGAGLAGTALLAGAVLHGCEGESC